MNLRQMFFPKSPARPAAVAAVEAPAIPDAGSMPADFANVVNLPLTATDGQTNTAQPESAPGTARAVAPGLMDAEALRAFFADNHFGLGRHDGAKYRTQEALVQGKAAIASRFQNVLDGLLEQRRVAANRLQDALLQTDGLCANTTARLRLALANQERDMEALRGQHALAGHGQGWVLDALNRYQIGFGKGLREALEFQLLGH